MGPDSIVDKKLKFPYAYIWGGSGPRKEAENQPMDRILNQEILRKLDNLTQLQKLTPRGRRAIIALLDLLEGEYGVVLSSGQASMFISHLTETFRRMDCGEPLELMEASTAGQIRSFGGSGIVDQMVKDFCRITGIRFPHSEEEYFKMYLSSLLCYGGEE